MLVGVFGDAHAHAEAFDAVFEAAVRAGAEQLWSLGDMVGGGPDPEHVVRRTRELCTVALLGNHDYGATGSAEPARFGAAGSGAVRSVELARDRLAPGDLAWMKRRRPAARRGEVRCWHGSPRNPVHEYVGPGNAAACLAAQRGPLGLVGHTHLAAAWQQVPEGARRIGVRPGEPLDVSAGRWLLNPGAVGAPLPPRGRWWDGLDAEAADGAWWLLLDLDRRVATWWRAPFDPAPARARAAALGLVDDA